MKVQKRIGSVQLHLAFNGRKVQTKCGGKRKLPNDKRLRHLSKDLSLSADSA